MEHWLGSIILAGILAIDESASRKGPEVLNFDQKISINADSIALGSLLRLWDQATGMQSTVPPELVNVNLSVRFTGLSVNEAARKIFNGQPFDYVLIEGQGIVVIARSQNDSGPEQVPAGNNVPQVIDQPVLQEPPKPTAQPPQPQPTIIQTPFGPLVIPSGKQQTVPIDLPPVLGAPPQPSFFAPPVPITPPAGVANGPPQNNLFGPLPIYQGPSLPASNPQQRP
jgi:hypothetical protein